MEMKFNEFARGMEMKEKSVIKDSQDHSYYVFGVINLCNEPEHIKHSGSMSLMQCAYLKLIRDCEK